MAIDSAAKRRSVAGLPFFLFGPGVTPDATPNYEWRQVAGWGYSGIQASEQEALVLVGSINDRMKQYLEATHIPGVFAAADFMTLLQYDLSTRTGDVTARFKALIEDASA